MGGTSENMPLSKTGLIYCEQMFFSSKVKSESEFLNRMRKGNEPYITLLLADDFWL